MSGKRSRIAGVPLYSLGLDGSRGFKPPRKERTEPLVVKLSVGKAAHQKGWMKVRSFNEAKSVLKSGYVTDLKIDFDLGNKTASDLIDWINEENITVNNIEVI